MARVRRLRVLQVLEVKTMFLRRVSCPLKNCSFNCPECTWLSSVELELLRAFVPRYEEAAGSV